MKKEVFPFILTIFSLFTFSCTQLVDKWGPTVNPELLFIDSRAAIIGWDNVGEEYSYEAWCYTEKEGLWISFDGNDTLEKKERLVVSVLSPTKECVFEINELSPAKDYEVIIYTHSDSDNEKVHSNFIQFAFKTKDE